jgi:hypothetical protein
MIFTNAGNVRTVKPNKQPAKANEQPSTPKSAPLTFKNAELLHKQPVQYADLHTSMRSDSKTSMASNSVNINTNVTPTALTNSSATNSISQVQANRLNTGPDISSARRTTVEEEYGRSTSTPANYESLSLIASVSGTNVSTTGICESGIHGHAIVEVKEENQIHEKRSH